MADTSVLLNLGRVGQIELLLRLFREVVTPPEVAAEFHRLAAPAPRFAGLNLPAWVRQQSATVVPALVRAATGLDSGESAALALAVELRADAILVDERRGHAVAMPLGLRPLGVLAILPQAKASGALDRLEPVLNRLQTEAGFWIAPSLRARVLQLAGE